MGKDIRKAIVAGAVALALGIPSVPVQAEPFTFEEGRVVRDFLKNNKKEVIRRATIKRALEIEEEMRNFEGTLIQEPITREERIMALKVAKVAYARRKFLHAQRRRIGELPWRRIIAIIAFYRATKSPA